ncbi:hypothetical protein HJC23_008197 [Cyclotella cryptica]|uniref:Uncharacterized protein n=1 Tax=Cyclotella cryptica TaxID=29204 RepID=A0ABD3PH73_9STRA
MTATPLTATDRKTDTNTQTEEATTATAEGTTPTGAANSSPSTSGEIATPGMPRPTFAAMHGAGNDDYINQRDKVQLHTREDELVGPPRLEPALLALHDMARRPDDHRSNYATAVMNADYQTFQQHSHAFTANSAFYQDGASSTQEDDSTSAASSWEISKLVMHGQSQQRHMQHQMWERYDGVGVGGW